MGYEKKYAEKLVSAQQAVSIIQTGDWIDYGFCTNHPVVLDKALAERMEEHPELTDLNFRGAIALWTPSVTEVTDASKRMKWNSWHTSGISRRLVEKGIAYYIPLRYSEMLRYYRENIRHVDVLMMQVAPMDEQGYFNFGLNASQLSAVCDVAKTIIVEVNQNMPVCFGRENASNDEVGVHIDRVDMIVEGNHPPIAELFSGKVTEVEHAIAKHVVPQISNGACLQLGIGGMPNAVGSLIAKSDLKDLGVHTEIYVDAFVEMTEAGKITGKYKSHNKGRQVYTFAAGTKKMYEYLHKNPEMMAAPVDYVNDIRVLSDLDNLISINNAIEVDLAGQVASETSGFRHISGAGGQLDFVLGSYLSKGGKSFICCSSTYKDKSGTVKSRLTPYITPGGIVTVTRANIQYLVTEYGIVNLKGAATWERAEKIISIAHPDFREQLIKDAEKMKIWCPSNKR